MVTTAQVASEEHKWNYPSGPKDLKHAYTNLAYKFHGLASQGKSIDCWASELSGQTLTLLAHLRRLQGELRWRQAVSNLTAAEKEALFGS